MLGFMAATAFLSMWISNTATTMMMVPIAMAIIIKLKESSSTPQMSRFAVGLLISIAYAASIGGIATLIGTPPNLAFSKIYQTLFPQAPDITFAGWMLFGLPVSVVFMAIAWWLVSVMFVRNPADITPDRSVFAAERKQLGPMSYEEKVVAVLFTLLALLWLLRRDIEIGGFVIPGWASIFSVPNFIDDGTVAIAVAMLLFLIPARSNRGARIMNWETAQRLHWGIVILFGGGFALAAGFKESELSGWIAGQLTGLADVPPVVMVASVCGMLTFLTELTSNTATTQIVLPLLGSLAVAIKTNPLLLMIPATLSASFAFMLPVATPPNAIIFGTGEVRMADMIKVGIILNLLGVLVITAMMYLLGLGVFDIDISHLPTWV